MTQLYHEVTIQAPISRVWEVLSNLNAVGHYNPMVNQVEIVSGKTQGVGAERLCQLKDGKFAKEKVTALQPEKSISFELTGHAWPLVYMRWTTRLKAVASGTLLSTDSEYAPSMGLAGKLLNALVMRRQMAKMIGLTHQNMKRYIETL